MGVKLQKEGRNQCKNPSRSRDCNAGRGITWDAEGEMQGGENLGGRDRVKMDEKKDIDCKRARRSEYRKRMRVAFRFFC
jgi:hypothetical protein